MKKIIFSFVIFLLLFCTFCCARFFKDNNSLKNYSFKEENIIMPSNEALVRFSNGLKIKTISNPDYEKTNFAEFDKFIKYLGKTYPLVFKKCEFNLINKYGIVLKLKGKDSQKLPNLMIGHYDVVGVKNENNWEYPPFSGYYDKEYVYSRGTLDDKGSVFAILEALNDLLKTNFQPESDLYIAFAHTEETGSNEGAPKIVNYFRENNIKFNTTLDEGGVISNQDGNFYAFIGTAEKGRLLTKITLYGDPAHASLPTQNSAVSKLAKLIQAFSNRTDAIKISQDAKKYYKSTYNSHSLFMRFLISNMDILRPLFVREMSKKPDDLARISSTYAITILEASNVQNAVSADASMMIDTRMLPGYTTNDVKKYINKVVAKTLPNEKVKIEYLSVIEPSVSKNNDNSEFEKLSRVIRNIYPDIPISPYLVLGATDARAYNLISDNTFRFLPCVLTPEEAGLMHVDNEKLSIKNWGRMITFYKGYILSK